MFVDGSFCRNVALMKPGLIGHGSVRLCCRLLA
jgi:hypothetical protein